MVLMGVVMPLATPAEAMSLALSVMPRLLETERLWSLLSTDLRAIQRSWVSLQTFILSLNCTHTVGHLGELRSAAAASDSAADKALNTAEGAVHLADDGLDLSLGDGSSRSSAGESERSDDSRELHYFGCAWIKQKGVTC